MNLTFRFVRSSLIFMSEKYWKMQYRSLISENLLWLIYKLTGSSSILVTLKFVPFQYMEKDPVIFK